MVTPGRIAVAAQVDPSYSNYDCKFSGNLILEEIGKISGNYYIMASFHTCFM